MIELLSSNDIDELRQSILTKLFVDSRLYRFIQSIDSQFICKCHSIEFKTKTVNDKYSAIEVNFNYPLAIYEHRKLDYISFPSLFHLGERILIFRRMDIQMQID